DASALRLSFAASSALARQIDHGAPAALFVSADEAWMDHLDARGTLVAGTRRVIATNRLVLVAHGEASTDTPRPLGTKTGLSARLGRGRLAVALTDAVPAGRYARAALESLSLWSALQGRLAETDNVRAALALVARGEVPFGIVYASDARAEPRVHIAATIPAESHPPIRYPAALLANAPETAWAAAGGFLDYLSGERGQAILARHGFGPVEPPPRVKGTRAG
ncbi:MAG: molybdate ABC transporter substrate-binding protein, partial [Pseudomonadota bacterium]